MNKLEIAPHMLYRAAKSYVEAQDDFDYIQAVLLAGSAMYICEPLLQEQGKPTQAMERAERIIKLREAKVEREKGEELKLKITWDANPISEAEKNKIRDSTRIEDRKVYNSLKHAGVFYFDRRKKEKVTLKKASDDLDMIEVFEEHQDLRSSAEEIIIDAIADYMNLDFSNEFQPYSLPEEIRRVLSCIYLEEAFEGEE